MIHRLRHLDLLHLKLQMALHAGIVTNDFFLEGFKAITRQREAEVVNGAASAIRSEHAIARCAAYDVLTSFATTNSVRVTTQNAFLRNAGIRNHLLNIK